MVTTRRTVILAGPFRFRVGLDNARSRPCAVAVGGSNRANWATLRALAEQAGVAEVNSECRVLPQRSGTEHMIGGLA